MNENIHTIEDIRNKMEDDPLYAKAESYAMSSLGDIREMTILDVGCGNGMESAYFALQGAYVIGIDKRRTAISNSRDIAKRLGISSNCVFIRGLAETLPISTGSIDIVFSKSTIQYMNRRHVLNEYKRILKDSGKIILIENLPYNPLIICYRLYRRCFSKTAEEKNYVHSIKGYLTFSEIEWLGNLFSSVTHQEYHLFSVIPLYFANRKNNFLWVFLKEALFMIDGLLFCKIPIFKYLAWFTTIICNNSHAHNDA